MSNTAKIITIIVILAAVGGGAAFWHSHNGNDTSNMNSSTQSPKQSSPTTPAVSTNKVNIANMAFSPSAITVKKGTTVSWTNQDTVAHTATENDGKNGPSAPPLEPGKSYSFTFNELGTFHYHCSIHPEMTGTVTVTE